MAARLGSAHPLVRALGLDAPTDTARSLPVVALDALWDALVEHYGLAEPLRLAAELRASSFGLFTYLLGCAPTGNHAVRRLGAAYSSLLSEGIHYRVEAEGRHVTIHVEAIGAHRSAGAVLFATGAVAGFLRNEAEGAPLPREARLGLGERDGSAAQVGLASLAASPHPLLGNRSVAVPGHSSLVYDRAALERPMRGHDPELAALLEDAARRRRETPRPMAQEVRAHLLSTSPPAVASQAQVAAAIGCSPRGLRRRLAAEDMLEV